MTIVTIEIKFDIYITNTIFVITINKKRRKATLVLHNVI